MNTGLLLGVVVAGAIVLILIVLCAVAISIWREDHRPELAARSRSRGDRQVRRLTGLRIRGGGDSHLRPLGSPEADLKREQERLPPTAA